MSAGKGRSSGKPGSRTRGALKRRGPFTATLARTPGRSRLIYLTIPRTLTPPITRAWARTPVRASVDGVEWDTSVWRAKTGEGFLPVPKRVRGVKQPGEQVTVEFTFEDDE